MLNRGAARYPLGRDVTRAERPAGATGPLPGTAFRRYRAFFDQLTQG